MKYLAIFVIVCMIFNSGCFYCSSYVRTIGNKAYIGELKCIKSELPKDITIKLLECDYTIESGGHAICVVPWFNYINRYPLEKIYKECFIKIDKENMGNVTIKYGKLENEDVQVKIIANRVPWTEENYNIELIVENQRSISGYLSQSLLLIAVPTDIAASLVFIAAIPIIMPIGAIVECSSK